ncbi:MAG TPA: hypothetical protein VEJ68_02910 [Candidatus Bathyarchaeia archaeon]|nr:hypothetical protein [Candidatus Bathyarchaeia archaeon]
MIAQATVGLVKQPTIHSFWICYRCNITLRDEPSVSLHEEITKHSARKIEFNQKG